MKNILLTLLMTCFVGNAFADDTVTGLTVGSGTDWTMHVVLNNTQANYNAFQLDVTLPEGFTVNTENGVTASSTRLAKGENVEIGGEDVETPFVVNYAAQNEAGNVVRILGYNLGNNNIAGTAGAILKLNLTSATACDPSAVTATFSNVTFVKTDDQNNFVATDLAVEEQSGTEGKITNVEYALLGDVNKDKVVNTTDAVSIINYYLGKDKSADPIMVDVNGDGDVNTTDAVKVINIYLNK